MTEALYKKALEKRERLLKTLAEREVLRRESIKSLDKIVLTLSASMLAFSITFLDTTIVRIPVTELYWLWLCWAISLVSTPLSFWIGKMEKERGIDAVFKAIERVENAMREDRAVNADDERIEDARGWSTAVRFFTNLAPLSCIIGVILMMIFLYCN